MPRITPWNIHPCQNRILPSGSAKTNCAGLSTLPGSTPSGGTTCHYVIEFGCRHYSNQTKDYENNVINPLGELIAVPGLILKKDCVDGDTWSSRWGLDPDYPMLTELPEAGNPFVPSGLWASRQPYLPEWGGCTNFTGGGVCHWLQGDADDPYVLAGVGALCDDPMRLYSQCGVGPGRETNPCLAKWVLDLSDSETGIGGVILRFCSRWWGQSAIYVYDYNFHGFGAFVPDKRARFLLYSKSDGLYLPDCLFVRPAGIIPTYFGGTAPAESSTCDGSRCQPTEWTPYETDQRDFEECTIGVDFAAGIPITLQVCDTEYISTGQLGGPSPDSINLIDAEMLSYIPSGYQCNWIYYRFPLSQEGEDERAVAMFVYHNGSGWVYDAYYIDTTVPGTGSQRFNQLASAQSLSNPVESCIGVSFDPIVISGSDVNCDPLPPPFDPDDPPSQVTLTIPSLATAGDTSAANGCSNLFAANDAGCCDSLEGTYVLALISNTGTAVTYSLSPAGGCSETGSPCSSTNDTMTLTFTKSTERWQYSYSFFRNVGGVCTQIGSSSRRSLNNSIESPVVLSVNPVAPLDGCCVVDGDDPYVEWT